MIRHQGRDYSVNPGETILDALLRQGVDIPFSCRQGVCQTCLMKCSGGDVPPNAQDGLKETYAANGYFMSCVCIPTTDMTVEKLDAEQDTIPGVLIQKRYLNETVVRLDIKPEGDFCCKPGQYVSLVLPDGLSRCYSIANQYDQDGFLEIHMKQHPEGQMSAWALEAEVGARIGIRGPAGTCFYIPGNEPFDMMLVGAGTGLAPLHGIIKDALYHKHPGLIHLLYGALSYNDFYYLDELEKLAVGAPNFHFDLCTKALNEEFEKSIVLTPNMKVYCCGSPDLVKSLKKTAFLAGVASKNILSDAFFSRV